MEAVPVSGIYLIKHYRHRLPHEATLLEGEHFPQCHFCWEKVRFRLVRSATSAERDGDLAQPTETVPVK
jgi:hypothetical protein